MSSIPLLSSNTQTLKNPLMHTLTEMSTLSIEQLKLLANFFKFELAKYNIRIETLQLVCLTAAVLTCTAGLSAKSMSRRHEDVYISLVLVTMIGIMTTAILCGQLIATKFQYNTQVAWRDRCVNLINFKTAALKG